MKPLSENSTPFIKLLKTPRCFYFYDVNTDTVVNVSEMAYQLLIDNNSILSSDNPEIVQLFAEGYLSAHRPIEIRHEFSDIIKYQLENNLEQITLQITQACNLCCKYCPYADNISNMQRNHTNKKMSWETAKKSIDYFMEHSYDTKEVAIGFYGGEPLLEIELIYKTVEYVENNFPGKKITFVITTNATLLSDEFITYAKEHNFLLTISLDGPQEIQDENRVFANGRGSFDIVYKNLSNAVNRMKESEMPLAINMVFSTKCDLDDVDQLLASDEIEDVLVSTSLIDDSMLSEKVEYSESFYIKFEYSNFLAWLSYLKIVPDIKITKRQSVFIEQINQDYLTLNKKHAVGDVVAPSGPCMPGQTRLFVTAEGKFLPCERVSETAADLCIGNVDDGIDVTRAYNLLNIGSITADKCKNCWAISHCVLCAQHAVCNGTISAEAKIGHCNETFDAFLNQLKNYLLIKEYKNIYGRG